MAKSAIHRELVDSIDRWWRNPTSMVQELFATEPDPWQSDVLQCFPTTPQIAMTACKGPGKTCVIAWLCWNFLLTRPDPNIAATSINGDNLKDGLWKEMAMWRNKSPLLQSLFEITSERIFRKGHKDTWFMSARTWPKTGNAQSQADTLAGLHTNYVMFVLDESGGIPVSVLVAAEAAMSSGTEAHILQAGNPTSLDGALYAAYKDRIENGGGYRVFEITGDPDDPKRAPRASIEYARDQIRKYGRDNPWVLVNIFGRFPPGSINTLISEDEVRAAMKRYYRSHEIGDVAKVMGIDVAREGLDSSVICMRQGIQTYPLRRYRGVSSGVTGASIANRHWNEFDADGCFIDATGGWGFTWIDQLEVLGRSPIRVTFNGKASQDERFVNRRAEIYWRAADAIRNGAALPGAETDGAVELLEAMSKTQYFHNKDRIQIEDKDQIKERLGFSPDEADAFCFEAGTLIETPSGARQIETLRIGDEVLTPFGKSRVAALWDSQSAERASVRFSNGSTLVGTPNHEIFAFGRGKVRLDALALTMEVSPLEERSKWQTLNGLFTTARSTGFKRAAGIIAPVLQSSVSGFCIAGFGLSLMARFQKAWLSTTRTMTGVTILPEIWRSSRLANTPAIICSNISVGPASALSTLPAWAPLERWLQNGTDPKRGALGIGSTASTPSRSGKPSNSNARPAARNFAANILLIGRAIAPALAIRKWLSAAISRTFGSALGAARSFMQTVTGQRCVVPVSVVINAVVPRSVYNLTLETDNAYYANGILVFNCLTFADHITPKQRVGRVSHTAQQEWNPFKTVEGPQPRQAMAATNWDPYRSGQ